MLLSVENLRKTFSGTPVLHGIDLEIEKGNEETWSRSSGRADRERPRFYVA